MPTWKIPSCSPPGSPPSSPFTAVQEHVILKPSKMRSFDNEEWTEDGKFQSTIPEENEEHARLVREAPARYEEEVNKSSVLETSGHPEYYERSTYFPAGLSRSCNRN